MEYNWLEHWEKNDIGFHQRSGNSFLKEYWSALKLKPKAQVFVPLCGKSLDLLWLADQGYQVTGVELSDIACEAFFKENNLNFSIVEIGKYKFYRSSRIQIFCGDFFTLTQRELPMVGAVYDRAALVALANDLRQRYVHHLGALLLPKSQILLIVYDTVNKVQGPPYALSREEIENLFASNFTITELARKAKTELPKHLCLKGYSAMQTFEVVYQLKKY